MIRFTLADLERANDAWGCNCGPAALAAICGMTLDEARQRLQGFDAKRYTNPTMMFSALDSIGRPWQRIRTSQPPGAAAHMPRWGLCRIQWEGPWTQPGVSMRARYRYTHWIGAAKRTSDASIGVFDVNSVAHTPDNSGWTSLEAWADIIVPWIVSGIKRATGGWSVSVTHAIEVERR